MRLDRVDTLERIGMQVSGVIGAGHLVSGDEVAIYEGDRYLGTARAGVTFLCRPGTEPIDRPTTLSLRTDVDVKAGQTLRAVSAD